MKLTLTDSATAQLLEAADWYQEQEPGTESRFLHSVHVALVAIRERPLLYAELEPGVRRVRTKNFPYYVYYRLRGEFVRVVAVVHTSRRPGAWREEA